METLAQRFHKIHSRAQPVLSTCLYGLVASLAAVAFQVSINWIYKRCYTIPSQGSLWHFGLISLAAIVTSSLLAGWLLTSYCPEAAGSGIPQVKLATMPLGKTSVPAARSSTPVSCRWAAT